MLIHPMVERLRGLGLTAMADAFTEMQRNSAADDLSREDWLGLLVDREATARENKRILPRDRPSRWCGRIPRPGSWRPSCTPCAPGATRPGQGIRSCTPTARCPTWC
jgi:hypothetical protein